MAIEGGCSWIQLRLAPNEDNDGLHGLLEELTELCQETSTFLVVENHPEIAERFRLHGVHIGIDSDIDPRELREQLGPHAVIGVEVNATDSILRLKDADIDYVTIAGTTSKEKRAVIAAEAAVARNIIPIVFSGHFTVEELCDSLRQGASGVCIGSQIVDADDPVSCTRDIIANLQKASSR